MNTFKRMEALAQNYGTKAGAYKLEDLITAMQMTDAQKQIHKAYMGCKDEFRREISLPQFEASYNVIKGIDAKAEASDDEAVQGEPEYYTWDIRSPNGFSLTPYDVVYIRTAANRGLWKLLPPQFDTSHCTGSFDSIIWKVIRQTNTCVSAYLAYFCSPVLNPNSHVHKELLIKAITNSFGVLNVEKHIATNSPIQGFCADMVAASELAHAKSEIDFTWNAFPLYSVNRYTNKDYIGRIEYAYIYSDCGTLRVQYIAGEDKDLTQPIPKEELLWRIRYTEKHVALEWAANVTSHDDVITQLDFILDDLPSKGVILRKQKQKAEPIIEAQPKSDTFDAFKHIPESAMRIFRNPTKTHCKVYVYLDRAPRVSKLRSPLIKDLSRNFYTIPDGGISRPIRCHSTDIVSLSSDVSITVRYQDNNVLCFKFNPKHHIPDNNLWVKKLVGALASHIIYTDYTNKGIKDE